MFVGGLDALKATTYFTNQPNMHSIIILKKIRQI